MRSIFEKSKKPLILKIMNEYNFNKPAEKIAIEESKEEVKEKKQVKKIEVAENSKKEYASFSHFLLDVKKFVTENNIEIDLPEVISIFKLLGEYEDFNIKFINRPSNITYREGTNDSECIYAELTFNTYDSNSGHNLKLLSTGDIDNTAVSNFTYNENNSIDNIYHLIYDITNNRTFAIISNNTYSAYLYPLNLTMYNKGIVINIDSSLINTYDTNFNDYYSIRNEKSNVVSLRCDYLNSIRMCFNKAGGYQLGLICGFTEINNQEGDC